MNKPLDLTALAEAATGLALVVAPSLVGQLLFGTELGGVAVVLDRVAGIALVALGVACWPGFPALCGMLSRRATMPARHCARRTSTGSRRYHSSK